MNRIFKKKSIKKYLARSILDQVLTVRDYRLIWGWQFNSFCTDFGIKRLLLSLYIFEVLINLSLIKKVIIVSCSFICVYALFVFSFESRLPMSKFRPDSVVVVSSPSQPMVTAHTCVEGSVHLLGAYTPQVAQLTR